MPQIQDKVNVRTRTSYIDVTAYWKLLGRRTTWILAALTVALFFALSLVVDSRRLLWYDEISTVTMARLPGMAAIWHAMHLPIDASTPTYFFLERLVDSSLHQTALSARLLSSIAAALGLLVVFDCVRRLVGGLWGLAALGFLMCSFLPFYSYEARAYALCFLFSSAALWVWLNAGRDGWRSPTLFGMCFLLGELSHYYFVFGLVPYLAYVMFTWPDQKRRLRFLGAASGGVIAAGLVLLPAVPAVRALSKNFWAAVNLSDLNAFSRFFPYAMVPLALAAIWLALFSFFRSGKPVKVARAGPAEQLGWLFLLIPLVGLVVAKFVTHAYIERYFIGFLPGVAVAVACFCSRMLPGRLIAPAGLVAILLAFGLAEQARSAIHPETVEAGPGLIQQQKTIAIREVEPQIVNEGKQFILVEASVPFLEGHYYARHPDMYFYIPQLNMGSGDRTQAVTLTNMSRLGAFGLWTVNDLLKNAAETALVDPEEGLIRLLRGKGYTLTVRAVDPVPVYYIEKP